MTLDVQLLTMVSMIICGFYLGVALDTYNRFARIWKGRQLLTYLIAIIFWLLQVSIVFYVLYQVNYGELRIYVFLACLLGFAIYQVLAASLYRNFLEMMINFVRRLLEVIYNIFQAIILKPFLIIVRLILSVIKFIGKVIFTVITWLLFPLKRLAIIPYRFIKNKIKKIFDKNPLLYSIIEFIYSKIRTLISLMRR